MTDGRTFWWAKDAAWHDREYIVILGAEFGAAGPNLIDVLSCMAKLENHGGRVKTGYVSLTRKSNIDNEQTTRAIVARAVEIGALDDFEEGALTFTARVSGWKADQDLARAAVRQDRHRATAAIDDSPAQVRDTPLRDVTRRNEPSPIAEQSRAEDSKKATSSLRADETDRLFEYWQVMCGHPQAKLTRDRRRKIEARLREGYTPEQIRTAIDGAARAAFVDESGKKFDDIELICRSGSKLESFIERATRSGPTAVSSRRPSPSDLLRALDGGAA